jgi:hypothetical protein
MKRSNPFLFMGRCVGKSPPDPLKGETIYVPPLEREAKTTKPCLPLEGDSKTAKTNASPLREIPRQLKQMPPP